MRHCLALIALSLLTACAGMTPEPESSDPDHKQFVTGSRIPYKGRGGPDAVKTMTKEGMADQMRNVIEPRPTSG